MLWSVDCQQLKRMGAKSAGRFGPSMASFWLPACTAWCGGTWHVTIWTWVKRWQPWVVNTDLGGGRQHAEPWLAHQEGWPLNCLQQQLWALQVHRERTQNQAGSWQPKVNGGHATGACCAPQQFTGMADLFHCTWTFSWEPTWDGKRSTYVKAQHRAANWVAESEWGPHDRNVMSPTAVHRDRWLHCMLRPPPGVYVDAIEAVSKPGSRLAGWHQTDWRSSRLGLPGSLSAV
jgi:hypothetical protein